MKRGSSPYCDFTVSKQPRSCCSALIWSILSIISCRLCSVENFFRSSSSTFNSPASCSQLAIGYPSSCEAWWSIAHFFFLSYEGAKRALQGVYSPTVIGWAVDRLDTPVSPARPWYSLLYGEV